MCLHLVPFPHYVQNGHLRVLDQDHTLRFLCGTTVWMLCFGSLAFLMRKFRRFFIFFTPVSSSTQAIMKAGKPKQLIYMVLIRSLNDPISTMIYLVPALLNRFYIWDFFYFFELVFYMRLTWSNKINIYIFKIMIIYKITKYSASSFVSLNDHIIHHFIRTVYKRRQRDIQYISIIPGLPFLL